MMSEVNNTEHHNYLHSMLEGQHHMFDTWKNTVMLFQPESLQEAFGESFEKMMQEWLNNQKKMMDEWMDNQKKMMESYQNVLGGGAMLPFAVDPREITNRMNDFFGDWFKITTKNISELSKWVPTEAAREAFMQMFRNSGGYNQLFDFWNMFINPNAALQNFNQPLEAWMDNYSKILEQFFPYALGKTFSSLLHGAAETGSSINSTMEKFIRPWVDASADLQKSITGAMQGDRNAYIDFLRTWQEAFQDSYGRVLNAPSLGFSKETNEKILKSIDAYLAYLYSANEFSLSLYKVGYDAMNKIMDTVGDEKAPTTFKEFYDLWIETNEEAYINMFREESFAKMLGNLVDTGVTFKRRYDELLMDALNQFPIPTDRDMDSVYKKMYDMKKEINNLNSTIEGIRHKFEEKDNKDNHYEAH